MKVKEALISLFFLRPAVDAYRVSTIHEDDGTTIDPLSEMMLNKGTELATESIPGCVLQLYVWLTNPSQAGSYALVSIGISALTTGYTSALMALDLDVDVSRRQVQPKFYGYIPDDNALRGRCFILMTLMSTLHNASRSLGCALLAAAPEGKLLNGYFIGGEVLLYLILKIIRSDFFYWVKVEGKGALAIACGFFPRVLVYVITQFSGCMHMRHPFELGGE